jgi:hypothetical protein
VIACAVVAAACSAGAKSPPPGAVDSGGVDSPTGPPPPSDQVPPLGQAKLEPWLAAGTYKAWTCEKQISSPRAAPAMPTLIGTHGRHRICTNDLLLASNTVPYPVGAASVKELFDANDGPYGYAVAVKVAPGTAANTWYWYERIGRLATLQPVADGIGDDKSPTATCGNDCHSMAVDDNVFIRAAK